MGLRLNSLSHPGAPGKSFWISPLAPEFLFYPGVVIISDDFNDAWT